MRPSKPPHPLLTEAVATFQRRSKPYCVILLLATSEGTQLMLGSFGFSASSFFQRQVFAMGSPFRVESVSVLDRNEVSSSTFLVFGWSLRDGVTLSGRGCPRSRSERRLFAHLP